MKKLLTLALLLLLSNLTSQAFTGPATGCIASFSNFHPDSLSTGGTWSSSDTLVATIDPVGGYAYCMGVGTTTISYTLGSSVTTATFTVYDQLIPVMGPSVICLGVPTAFTDAVPGGVWSSLYPSAITVDSVTGVATGLVPGGYSNIVYNVPGYCSSSAPAFVAATTTDTFYFGSSHICLGGGTAYFPVYGTSSGTWSSSDTSIASVDTSGYVSGIAAGNATISYVAAGPCGTTNTYVESVVVSSTTYSGGIFGAPTAAVAGDMFYLYEDVFGGTWSSSDTSVATIDPLTGIGVFVSHGTVTISYTVSGCSGIATSTITFSASPYDGISGYVNFNSGGTAVYYGDVKVWLISGTAPALAAVDSFTSGYYGNGFFYSFPGVPAGNYLIKAAVVDSGFLSPTGYLPTYHTSSFYWTTADVVVHATGGEDVNKNMNMIYGTAYSGVGTIEGLVTTGADKGTTADVPVKGLMMYVFNSTGQLMQGLRTDANGRYSFGGLPTGATYYVFPDSLNYLTTPYTAIHLTPSAPIMNVADFIQHTLSHTITPVPAGVGVVNGPTASLLTSPNPTTGKVNISWQLPEARQGTVTVADVAGRIVYTAHINMASGTGNSQIDLSSLNNGLYIISVKSEAINYNNKIQVQH